MACPASVLYISAGSVYDTEVAVPRVVLDTNVLVAASQSGRGASAKLLSLVGSGRFEIALSVPLVVEWEGAVLRDEERGSKRYEILSDILDYLCAVGFRQEIFFLWRPQLRDPKDEMVLEVAVAAGCDAIITYNRRDFGNVERFGLEVLTPKEFLSEIGVLK